jgi:hypothetical protein
VIYPYQGSFALTHELAHLADYVNHYGYTFDVPKSEMWASMLEYRGQEDWAAVPPRYDNIPYGVSLKKGPYESGYTPYQMYRLFGGYLFHHYSAAADTGDLVYKWGRYKNGSNVPDTYFSGLATIMNQSPWSGVISGSGAGDKLGNVLHRYGIARYVDNNSYAGGIYGFGSDVHPSYFKLFEWVDQNWARAEIVPPALRLGAAQGDGLPDTLSTGTELSPPSGTENSPPR